MLIAAAVPLSVTVAPVSPPAVMVPFVTVSVVVSVSLGFVASATESPASEIAACSPPLSVPVSVSVMAAVSATVIVNGCAPELTTPSVVVAVSVSLPWKLAVAGVARARQRRVDRRRRPLSVTVAPVWPPAVMVPFVTVSVVVSVSLGFVASATESPASEIAACSPPLSVPSAFP